MNSIGTDILLAEESLEDAEITIRALRRENVAENIFVARDGEQALDFVFCRSKFAARSPDPPKLILLDLKLPRVNGLEVLKQLKDDPRTKAIPAVIPDFFPGRRSPGSQLRSGSQQLYPETN
jgi:two-component system, response regulator